MITSNKLETCNINRKKERMVRVKTSKLQRFGMHSTLHTQCFTLPCNYCQGRVSRRSKTQEKGKDGRKEEK